LKKVFLMPQYKGLVKLSFFAVSISVGVADTSGLTPHSLNTKYEFNRSVVGLFLWGLWLADELLPLFRPPELPLDESSFEGGLEAKAADAPN
jgi:hypothetical protein